MSGGKQWLMSFLLALGVHAVFFVTAGYLGQQAPRVLRLETAAGDAPMELTVVVAEEPAPAAFAAPAAPAPEPKPEVKIEEPPPIKPPEPVMAPEPKPVLTEPAPEAAVLPPVEKPVDREARVDKVDHLDKMDGMDTRKESAQEMVAGQGGAGAPAAPSRPVGVEGGAALLSTIYPRYPMGSRIRGEEGPVLVRARVDRRGVPAEVAVLHSSGYRALDEAAVKAVKGARFVPPAPGAPAESSIAELTIRFQLKDK